MSDNIQKNNNSEEIDLAVLFQKIKGFFKWIIKGIYNIFLFYKRFAVIVIILLVIGFVAGYFMDTTASKTYKNEVIVVPNFGSVDYLYSSVEELEAKRRIGDISFFKSMGIDSVSYFSGIEIEPIVDIYSFLGENESNLNAFRALKGDASSAKEMETAKNYKFHRITIYTRTRKNSAKVISRIMDFLNNNEYFNSLKDSLRTNIDNRIKVNRQVVGYINDILRMQGNDSINRGIPDDKLFYFRAESLTGSMGDLVSSQQELFDDIDKLTINATDTDKVIKEVAVKTNIPKKGITSTKKWLFPLLLFIVFSGVSLFIYLFRRVKEIATEE
ncbi:hypothetical protein [Sinomicrobium weinanense]|uniref:Uncharacterized protein n=1 Tax=Sinomicrobium weinanense TaxID=2842200 RepID=A0A926JVD7_9FLAO|nr:hypothetical protein [Sinomicrobium weinanense]MBC9797898.1 hypothetical protein [Sinomicrobium weinanense]MBU3125435.1 hypothetical protein [Sinomicrobium weinanense]